ncbi:hypothetical protein E8E12_009436 [Didymella heteroderae]|uniref:Uncharacterized protein n=1 Tax=Didymella heteroderae TaxID=1769908 RepID=A0A9P5C5P6_9PLEO|nr:hypothetical protein E8E12_009436 [Didymella heteroderae]
MNRPEDNSTSNHDSGSMARSSLAAAKSERSCACTTGAYCDAHDPEHSYDVIESCGSEGVVNHSGSDGDEEKDSPPGQRMHENIRDINGQSRRNENSTSSQYVLHERRKELLHVTEDDYNSASWQDWNAIDSELNNVLEADRQSDVFSNEDGAQAHLAQLNEGLPPEDDESLVSDDRTLADDTSDSAYNEMDERTGEESLPSRARPLSTLMWLLEQMDEQPLGWQQPPVLEDDADNLYNEASSPYVSRIATSERPIVQGPPSPGPGIGALFVPEEIEGVDLFYHFDVRPLRLSAEFEHTRGLAKDHLLVPSDEEFLRNSQHRAERTASTYSFEESEKDDLMLQEKPGAKNDALGAYVEAQDESIRQVRRIEKIKQDPLVDSSSPGLLQTTDFPVRAEWQEHSQDAISGYLTHQSRHIPSIGGMKSQNRGPVDQGMRLRESGSPIRTSLSDIRDEKTRNEELHKNLDSSRRFRDKQLLDDTSISPASRKPPMQSESELLEYDKIAEGNHSDPFTSHRMTSTATGPKDRVLDARTVMPPKHNTGAQMDTTLKEAADTAMLTEMTVYVAFPVLFTTAIFSMDVVQLDHPWAAFGVVLLLATAMNLIAAKLVTRWSLYDGSRSCMASARRKGTDSHVKLTICVTLALLGTTAIFGMNMTPSDQSWNIVILTCIGVFLGTLIYLSEVFAAERKETSRYRHAINERPVISVPTTATRNKRGLKPSKAADNLRVAGSEASGRDETGSVPSKGRGTWLDSNRHSSIKSQQVKSSDCEEGSIPNQQPAQISQFVSKTGITQVVPVLKPLRLTAAHERAHAKGVKDPSNLGRTRLAVGQQVQRNDDQSWFLHDPLIILDAQNNVPSSTGGEEIVTSNDFVSLFLSNAWKPNFRSMWKHVQADLLSFMTLIDCLEPPLEDGLVRLRWQCRCGESSWGDVIEYREGGLNKVIKRMEDATGARITVTTHSNIPKNREWRFQLPRWARNSSSRSKRDQNGQSKLPQHNQAVPKTISAASTAVCKPASAGSSLRLLACMHRTQERVLLLQEPVDEVSNDLSLFHYMKKQLEQHRGRD